MHKNEDYLRKYLTENLVRKNDKTIRFILFSITPLLRFFLRTTIFGGDMKALEMEVLSLIT